MALDLSELIDLRDALIRARAAGTRSLTYDGKTVTYGSDSELASAIADLEVRIRRASSPTTSNTVRFSTSKGM